MFRSEVIGSPVRKDLGLRMAKGAAWMIALRLSIRGIGLVSMIVLARLLVPADFGLFSGDDFTVLPFIEQGGHGVVTVSGNVVPARMAELCRLASAGDSAAAKAIDDRLQPLNTALFLESNPIPVKWAVSQMGLISPFIRLPLTEYSEQYHEQMRAAMAGAGVETVA